MKKSHEMLHLFSIERSASFTTYYHDEEEVSKYKEAPTQFDQGKEPSFRTTSLISVNCHGSFRETLTQSWRSHHECSAADTQVRSLMSVNWRIFNLFSYQGDYIPSLSRYDLVLPLGKLDYSPI